MNILSSIDIFEKIESEDIASMAKMMIVEAFQKEEIIIESGKKPSAIFIIISGKKNFIKYLF